MTLFEGSCHIELIIGSLSLSILFLPNSNSFRLNSNIPDAQRSKNPFLYTNKDRHKKTYKKYVFLCIGKFTQICIGIPFFLIFFCRQLTKKFCDRRTLVNFVSRIRSSQSILKLIASPLHQTNPHLSVFSDDILSLGIT
jgi:hypothetical protein